MYNIERKAVIINLLETDGKISVSELSERFGLSKETIRRDLRELERTGILKRAHGGALLQEMYRNSAAEYAVSAREIQRHEEKDRICASAATYLKDGETVFIDNSSTCLYLVKHIPKHMHITILTNSIKLLLEIAQHEMNSLECICLGGHFRRANLSLHGSITLSSGTNYYPDKALISCAGIQQKSGITDSSASEVDVKKLMIERAQRVCVLADYSKFTRTGQYFVAELSKCDYLITDSRTDRAALSAIGQIVEHVVIAE